MPLDAKGFLIGRRGSTIRDIAIASGALIHIHADADTITPEAIVSFEGTSEEHIAWAKALIIKRLSQRQRQHKHQQWVATPPSTSDGAPQCTTSVSKRMEIPAASAGRLFGKAGRGIVDLQERTGCAVKVSLDWKAPSCNQGRFLDAYCCTQRLLRPFFCT